MKKIMGMIVVLASLCFGCASFDALDFSVARQYLRGEEKCLFLADEICQGGIVANEVEVLEHCLEATRSEWEHDAGMEEIMAMVQDLVLMKDELVSHAWTGMGDSEGLTFVAGADGAYSLRRQRKNGKMVTEDEGTWKLSLDEQGNVILELYHEDDPFGWSMGIELTQEALIISGGMVDSTHLTFRR